MNPPPGPSDTPPPGLVPAIVSTRPDTRAVPLDALRNRALIGADDLPQPEARAVVGVAAFNASL